MDKFINQMEPWFGDEEKEALSTYMGQGGWVTEFKQTEQFENMIKEKTGARYCSIVNNGTISLTLIALACGIKAGDEVIVPNYTMIATPNSLSLFGAVPVFTDVEEQTLCLNIEEIKKNITAKTKAIMLVSANGRYPASGINAFTSLCEEKGLILLEDSAQSLGSFYPDGRHIGRAGKAGSFSFSAPKIISTGQGGAIITDDEIIANKIKKLKDFGRSGGGNDIHDSLGYNFKFTDVQAVIGIEQMKKLEWRINRKKEIYKKYQELLKNCGSIKFFNQDLNYTTPWFIDVLADQRDDLQKHLKEQKIGTRVMYPPINQQKAYNQKGSFPVSETVGNKGLWLPSSSQLKDDEIEYICNNINNFYK